MSLAAKLPYDHPYAGGFSGIGSQPLPTDADALDYLSRMATADGAGVETGVAVAVDAFYRDAKELGLFSSIRASCVLAGARTLAGALVPLRDYGPELWDAPTPTILDSAGSSGAWDAATQTMRNDAVGGSTIYPRFRFGIGMAAGVTYKVEGTLTGDTASVASVRLAVSGGANYVSYDSGTGVLSGTLASAGDTIEFIFNGTLAPSSVTIESLSIREVIAEPTNVADGFVEGDYSRTAGITGDGTSYIDSGRANNADPEDDKHMAVYATTLASSGVNAYMGGYLVSPSRFSQLIRPGAATTFNSSINDATGVTLDLTQPGLICASRDGTSVHRRADDVTDVASSATTGNPNFSILVFSRNALGSPDSTSDATLAFYSIGTAISDLAAFEDSLDNLINRLKFALLVGENPSGLDPDTIDYIVRGYEAGGSLE